MAVKLLAYSPETIATLGDVRDERRASITPEPRIRDTLPRGGAPTQYGRVQQFEDDYRPALRQIAIPNQKGGLHAGEESTPEHTTAQVRLPSRALSLGSPLSIKYVAAPTGLRWGVPIDNAEGDLATSCVPSAAEQSSSC